MTISSLYGRFAEPRTLASRELGRGAVLPINSHVVVRPQYGHRWHEGRIVEVFGCQVKVRFPLLNIATFVNRKCGSYYFGTLVHNSHRETSAVARLAYEPTMWWFAHSSARHGKVGLPKRSSAKSRCVFLFETYRPLAVVYVTVLRPSYREIKGTRLWSERKLCSFFFFFLTIATLYLLL